MALGFVIVGWSDQSKTRKWDKLIATGNC
jgi:hypothetical protein